MSFFRRKSKAWWKKPGTPRLGPTFPEKKQNRCISVYVENPYWTMVSQVEIFRGREKKTYCNLSCKLYAQLVDISLIYMYNLYNFYNLLISKTPSHACRARDGSCPWVGWTRRLRSRLKIHEKWWFYGDFMQKIQEKSWFHGDVMQNIY